MIRKKAEMSLREKNIKPTSIRLDILELLLRSTTHPSADHIYLTLKDRVPTLSKTSIYNTLHLLESHDLVQKVLIEEESVRYDANLDCHSHFLCRSCRQVYDLEEDISQLPSLHEGFLVEKRQVYYQGICPNCQEKAKKFGS